MEGASLEHRYAFALAARAAYAVRPAHRDEKILARGFVGKLVIESVEGLHGQRLLKFCKEYPKVNRRDERHHNNRENQRAFVLHWINISALR
jgi:hypothetical protein